MFMDLTSLQDTLPDLHTTTDYSGSLAQPWVSQNSTMPYIHSGPQGGLSYVAGQDSRMLSSTQQGPFPPRNPFEWVIVKSLFADSGGERKLAQIETEMDTRVYYTRGIEANLCGIWNLEVNMLLGSRHSPLYQKGMHRSLSGRHCWNFFSPSNKMCPLLTWLMYLAGSAGKTSKFLSAVCICPWVVFMFLLVPVVNRTRSGIPMKWLGDYPYWSLI